MSFSFRSVFLIALLQLLVIMPKAQSLPVVRAHSRSVDIREGDLYRKGYWSVSPEVKPDTYSPDRFKGLERISFITDVDSISIEARPGAYYDFIILLDGRDSAFTRISTVQAAGLVYRSVRAVDTIPFRIGFNNQIIIRGSINGSKEIEMLFDTGANGLILSDDAGAKVHMDGQVQGFGLGGGSMDDYSRRNSLRLGTMVWDSVPLTVKHQGKPREDGVVGYNLFDGKVVEIDYEKQLLIIHRQLPPSAQAMTRYPLRFRNGLTYILLRAKVGTRVFDEWYDFDTGASGTLMLNQQSARMHRLYGTMEQLGSDRLKGSGPQRVSVLNCMLPELQIAGTSLRNVPIAVEDSTGPGVTPFNIVGNDLLKRFHILLDYGGQEVWMVPNSKTEDLYLYNKQHYIFWTALIAASLLLALLIRVFLVRRKKRKNNA